MCGGHPGGAVEQQGITCHDQRAEQEGVCPHRGLAKPPAAWREVTVCLRGRYLSAQELGWNV